MKVLSRKEGTEVGGRLGAAQIAPTATEVNRPGALDTLPPEAEQWLQGQVRREALNTRTVEALGVG